MPTTPTLALPYPPPTGVAPDVPYYMQQLAEATEAEVVKVKVVPAALLTRSTQTMVSNASYQKVPLNLAEVNRGGMASTATGRITITRPGLYLVSACVAWDSNATGVRYSAIYKNGALVRYATGPAASSGPTAYPVTVPLELAAGDYLELYGVQSGSASLGTQTIPHGATYLSAVFQED